MMATVEAILLWKVTEFTTVFKIDAQKEVVNSHMFAQKQNQAYEPSRALPNSDSIWLPAYPTEGNSKDSDGFKKEL